MSIEKIKNMNIKISLQPFCIHLRPMHDFDNTLIFHDPLKKWDFFPYGKDINNVVLLSGRDLYQAS